MRGPPFDNGLMSTQVTTIRAIDAGEIAEAADQAGSAMHDGQLAVFPTETVYGIGAALASAAGMEALRSFKGRPEKPFSVHLPDRDAVWRYVSDDSALLRRLVRKALPGPVTLLVEVSDSVIEQKVAALAAELESVCGADADPARLRACLYSRNTIGLRCPDHAAGQAVLGAVKGPVVASSANPKGADAPHDADEAAAYVGGAAAVIIDGRRCKYAKSSTIVRIAQGAAGTKLTVERDGVFDERFIRKLTRWTALMVCSGNTCRSPMAQALAAQMLAQQYNVAPDDLLSVGIVIESAGTYAASGQPASAEGVDAMARFGMDLARHRSRPVTSDLINEADVIYCMTAGHLRAIEQMSPQARDKLQMLDPNGDIDDPIGRDLTAYQRCAELIRRRLEVRLKEQQT